MAQADTSIRRDVRPERLAARGATIWLTGLPAAGKSTLAVNVEAYLIDGGRPAYVLDGDVLRQGLNRDLGFSAAERDENVRRTAHAAVLLADAGVVSLVALVSPYAQARLLARRLHEEEGIPFVEVFVDTPVSECEARDPKGHYALARSGRLDGLTGVDAPYERPVDAELVVRTTEQPLDVMVRLVIDALDLARANQR
jgi:bifunctional enzyme CysN/CysC